MSLRFFCLLVTLLTPVIAQDKSSTKAGGELQVKFLAEQAPERLGNVFLQLREKEKSQDFPLPTDRLSEPIAIAVRVMVLKTLDRETPLCTITLPDVGNEFAIVLVTAKPTGFQPIVVRTDDPSFQAGDVLFINRSEKTVLCKLGATPLILKAGEFAKSRPTGAIDHTYYDITFATREETGDKILSSTRWPTDNELRSYLFFFTNDQGKTAFRTVDGYLTPPAQIKP